MYIDWFSFWIEMEHKEGMRIYGDSIITWKMHIIEKFLGLKGFNVMFSEDIPVSVLKQKKKKVQKNNKQRRLQADESSCQSVNPLEFFGDRWGRVSRYLKKYHGMDTKTALKNGKKKDKGNKDIEKDIDTKQSLKTKMNVVIESCEGGVCLHVGSGLGWDARMDKGSIEWIYGMTTTMNKKTNSQASVKMNLAVHCFDTKEEGTKKDLDDIMSFSKMAQNKEMEFAVLFDGGKDRQKQSQEDLFGFALTIPFGNDVNVFDDESSVNFGYFKIGQIATQINVVDPNAPKKHVMAKEAQLDVGGHQTSYISDKVPMYFFIAFLLLIMYGFFKVCPFTSKYKQIDEKSPLLVLAKHRQQNKSIERIYTPKDTYGLLPKPVSEDV